MTEYLTLKTADCKNCYKCLRRCPVKSIGFDRDHARIVPEECILCGNCFVVCPQNAKEIRNDIAGAEGFIESGAPVYVSLAPSFTANYVDEKTGESFTLRAMEQALKALGFAGVEETALGAAIVKKQYDAMVNAGERDLIISSCCHSVNQLIRKYYPALLPAVAQILSPMQVHCMDIKRRRPGAKTVFIGPCIAKKEEAEIYPDFTDCVLTFGELSQWLERKNIGIRQAAEAKNERSRTRLFPSPGGILRSMERANPRFTYLAVDGMENCLRALEDAARGKLKKCFVEMSACAGSCTGGPVMEHRGLRTESGGPGSNEHPYYPLRDYIALSLYAGDKDFETETYSPEALEKKMEAQTPRKVHVGEDALTEVLRKIGKTRPEQELNCGTCGYDTCREKARAVLEGKANLFMCLPYLLERAESFSDDIIKNTPNGIIVLNETMEVQQINAASCRLLNINPADILGDQVVRILDPAPFMNAVMDGKNSYNKRTYLADYEKYVDQTVIYDKSYHIVICIMRDVTEETRQRKAKEDFSRKAVDITDRVIEKQMRAVQEIASLLGESTAETKIALTTLKESLADE